MTEKLVAEINALREEVYVLTNRLNSVKTVSEQIITMAVLEACKAAGIDPKDQTLLGVVQVLIKQRDDARARAGIPGEPP